MFIILLFCSIIIFIYSYFFCNKHSFWNHQPVIYYSSDCRFNILSELPSYIHSHNIKPITTSILLEFINIHYLKETIHNSYLTNLFNTTDYLFGFYTNQLHGTITARHITLSINNKLIPTLYVDYLCIEKQFQKRNIAPELIKRIITQMKTDKIPIAIFKTDIKPLPFKYFYKDTYYYFDLINPNTNPNPNNLLHLDDEHINDIYQFVMNKIKLTDLHEHYSIDIFKKYFINNDYTYSYYTIKDGKITGFVNLIKTKYKHEDKYISAMELIYCFDININNIIDKIKEIDNIEYIYSLKTNILKTDINKWKKGNNVYYHLYNHGIKNINNVSFNVH